MTWKYKTTKRIDSKEDMLDFNKYPILNGQTYFDSTNNLLFKDINNKRILFSETLKLVNETDLADWDTFKINNPEILGKSLVIKEPSTVDSYRLKYVTLDGNLIDMGGSGATYTLPTATATKLGGVKVGNRLSILDGILSAENQVENYYDKDEINDFKEAQATINDNFNTFKTSQETFNGTVALKTYVTDNFLEQGATAYDSTRLNGQLACQYVLKTETIDKAETATTASNLTNGTITATLTTDLNSDLDTEIPTSKAVNDWATIKFATKGEIVPKATYNTFVTAQEEINSTQATFKASQEAYNETVYTKNDADLTFLGINNKADTAATADNALALSNATLTTNLNSDLDTEIPTSKAVNDWVRENFYTAGQSNSKYLGINNKAADSNKLNGKLASEYALKSEAYVLPTATGTTLGGITVGKGLSRTTAGKISVSEPYTADERLKLSKIANYANNYSLPTATATTLGGVKVGNRLSILDGILSAENQVENYYDKDETDNKFLTGTSTISIDKITGDINATTLNGHSDTYFLNTESDLEGSKVIGNVPTATDAVNATHALILGPNVKQSASLELESFDCTSNSAIPTSKMINDWLTSNYYTAGQSNSKYLGINNKAADSNKLNGKLASEYALKSEAYVLPTATGTTLGGITVGKGLSRTTAGKISVSEPYTADERLKLSKIANYANNYSLPTATATTLGGVKVGNRLSVTDGEISADLQSTNDFSTTYKNKLDGIAAGANKYSLPAANASTLGGVKVGNRLSILDGILSADLQSTNDFSTTYKNKLDGIAAGANKYSLPISNTNTLGGVIIGDGLTVSTTGEIAISNPFTEDDETKLDGIAAGANNYSLPNATNSIKGGIKVGSGLSYDTSGKIWVSQTTANDFTDTEKLKLSRISEYANNYSLPNATDTKLGGVKVGDGLAFTTTGEISVSVPYTAAEKLKLSKIADHANKYSLPTATATKLGGVKVGNRLSVTDGEISADLQSTNDFSTTYKNKLDGIAAGANKYSLPAANASTLGGVKVGNRLSILDGILSADLQSTNDFSTTYKNKLDGIAAGANKYSLPISNTNTLGGVIIGDGLTVSTTGEIAISNPFTEDDETKLDGIAAGANNYSLPNATNSIKGGIKVGSGLSYDTSGKIWVSQTTANDFTDTEKLKLSRISEYANNYSLPNATDTKLGGVKVGDGLAFTTTGEISVSVPYTAAEKLKLSKIADHANKYSLPTATATKLGGVKVGNRLSVTDGEISADLQSTNDFSTTYKNKLDGIAAGANKYSLPAANASTLGGVKVGNRLSILDGILSADLQSTNDFSTTYKNKLDGLSNYSLPNATDTKLGGVKVGDGLTVSTTGEIAISVPYTTTEKLKLSKIAEYANNYSLPNATTTTKGGVIVGDRLSVTSGEISADLQSTNDFTNTYKNKLDGITAGANYYSLPKATEDTLGGVKVGNRLLIVNGLLSANLQSTNDFTNAYKTKLDGLSNYSLPNATDTKLGGVKVGARLSVTNGLLSANLQSTNDFSTTYKNKLDGIAAGANNYSLPAANASTLGGLKASYSNGILTLSTT